jgi:hypothetical protein
MLHRIIRGERVISATIRISIALLLMHKKKCPHIGIFLGFLMNLAQNLNGKH